MSSVHDQQILHQIENGLRAYDRAFYLRFALGQSVLRWAAPIGLVWMATAASAAQVTRAARAATAAGRGAAGAAAGRARSAALALRLILAKAGSNRAVRPAWAHEGCATPVRGDAGRGEQPAQCSNRRKGVGSRRPARLRPPGWAPKAGGPSAWTSLASFLEKASAEITADRALRQTLPCATSRRDWADPARTRIHLALTTLIERAQQAMRPAAN